MDFIALFKNLLIEKTDGVSALTLKNYLSDLRHFISWYENTTTRGFTPNDMDPDVISLYSSSSGAHITNGNLISETQMSFSSMKRHLSSLRKFFAVMEEAGQISGNPFKNLSSFSSSPSSPTDYWHLRSFQDSLLSNNASKLTVKNYLSDISSFARWYEESILPSLENPLTQTEGFYIISSDIVEEYKKRLIEIQGAAPRTINRKLSSLRKYLEFAGRKGFIAPSEMEFNALNITRAREFIPQGSSEANISLQDIKTANQNSKFDIQKSYSPFPPVRLLQKLILYPYLNFEEKAASAIAVLIAGKTYIGGLKLPKKTLSSLSAKNIIRAQNLTISGILGARNVEKKFFAPASISLRGLPIYKKLIHHARFTRPEWYKRYHNYAFVHYVHFTLLVIFASGVGAALYQNLVIQKQTPTFAAATAPPRIMSFQGRLTDNLDNPITTPTDVRFTLYNDPSATGAALLWQEVQYLIAPDQDGIFSVLLGSNATIPSTVFSDNSSIYLGVTIKQTAELTPRQRVASVAYATNSEFLQGQPPTTQAGITSYKNVILALDSSGNLTLSDSIATDHVFQANNGMFKISGQPLFLTTNSGSSGNVILSPDGLGKIDLQKPLINSGIGGNISPGGVEINDKFAVLATESAVAAFVVNNNTTGGDIFTASSSGTPRFTIANDGTVTSAVYTGQNGVLYGTQTSGVIAQATTASLNLCLVSGISAPSWTACPGGGTTDVFWGQTSGLLYPNNSTVDFAVGGQATTSAKFAVLNVNSGTPTASVSSGLNGTGAFFDANGNFQTVKKQTLTIGGNTTGNITFLPNNGLGLIGINTTSLPRASLDIRGNLGNGGTIPVASISGKTSFAALQIDNSGTGDLISASASGVPNFIVKNNGDVVVGLGGAGKITAAVIDPYLVQNQYTSGNTQLTFQTLASSNGDFVYKNQSTTLANLVQAGQFQLPITGSAGGLVLGGDTQLFRGAVNRLDLASGDSLNLVSGSLLTGGTTRIDSSGNGTFVNLNVTGGCTGCGSVTPSNSPFQVLSGSIVPLNSTLDFLIGGQATTSAKFAVLNVNGTRGTQTASISGSLVLDAAGSLQTTNNQTLTLGGSTTGNISLSPGGTTALFVQTGGNVGIGTTTPAYLADVNGTLRSNKYLLGNDLSLVPIVGGQSALSSWWGLQLVGNRQANIDYSPSNYGSAGDFSVIIPNQQPSSIGLVIQGASGQTENLQVWRDSNSNLLSIVRANGTFGIGTSLTGNAQLTINQPNSTGDIFTASASGTTRLTLSNSGNLNLISGVYQSSGIGGVSISNACVNTTGGIVTGTGTCPANTQSSLYWNQQNGSLFPNNSTVDFLVGAQATTSAKFAVLNVNSGTPVASVSGNFSLGSAGGTTRTIGATAMNNLQLGDANTGGISLAPSGTTALFAQTGGNVGIGTTAPGQQLHLSTSANISNGIRIQNTNTGNSAYAQVELIGGRQFNIGSAGSGTPGNNANHFFIYDSTAGATRFTLDGSGNFGLNTQAPLATLDVNGTASISGALKLYGAPIIQSTANQTLTLGGDSTGNIILSPNNGSGNIILSNLTGQNGVLYGTQTTGMLAQATTASTGLCLKSGASAPTWTSCGSVTASNSPFQILSGAIVPLNSTLDFLIGAQATASAEFSVLGINAGTNPTASVSATTGANNGNGIVIAGDGTIQSLRNNTLTIGGNTTGDLILKTNNNTVFRAPGNQNTFAGVGAGNNWTSSQQNAFFGKDAGHDNTTGGFNSLLGLSAGYKLSTGSNNAFVGWGAGHENNNTNNAFVGSFSGYSSTGTQNSFLGYGSGQNNTGDDNVIAGYLAGAAGTGNGSKNVILGSQAGISLTNGANNILIGYLAGDTATGANANTTGSNNTFIGFKAGSGTSTQLSNATALGNAATVSCSNCLVLGGINGINGATADTLVGIGTAIPVSPLHVTGGYGSNAAFILNQTNSGNIFTASASGTTRLTLSNSGNLNLVGGVYQSGGTSGVTVSSAACVTSTGGIVTGSGACPGGGGGGSNWTLSTVNGTLSPINNTVDFLLGGIATSSAKFAVLNMSGTGTPTVMTTGDLSIRGGTSNLTASADIANLNKSMGANVTDSWSTGAAGGTARASQQSILYNGRIYSWGGTTDGTNAINSLDIYDIANNSWSTGTAGGTARHSHTSVLYNGKIYSWGGYPTGSVSPLNTVDIYDIANNSWSTGTAGGTARRQHSSVLYNGSIYSWGGFNNAGSTINTVDIYNIANNSWSTGTAGGTARGGHSSVLYNGSIYSWGGFSGGAINTVDIYDIANNSWSTGTAGGTARYNHSSILYNGKIYSWGGYSGGVINTVDIYDIANKSWSTGTAGGTARNSHSSILYNGKLYSWGGNNAPINTVDIYNIGFRQSILALQENGQDTLSFQTGSQLFLSSGRFGIMGGNVGIGTSTPTSTFQVTHPAGSSLTGKALVIFDQTENQDIFTASASGLTKFVIANNGSVGIGTALSPTGINPQAMLQVYSSLGTLPAASISGKTSAPALLVTQDGSGDLFVASYSGKTGIRAYQSQAINGYPVTLDVGPSALGKVNAAFVDPPYTIDGLGYSTWMNSMLGLNEEYTGTTIPTYDPTQGAYAYKLDFNNFIYQSDAWVYNRIIDPDITKVRILLTANSRAKTWYKKDGKNRIITLYSDRPVELSYRLSAPRFDAERGKTFTGIAMGLIVPPPTTTGNSANDNNFAVDPYFASLTINQQNGQWVLKDSKHNAINQTEAFSKAIIANIQSGLINAQQIVTNSLNATSGTISNLTGNTLNFAQGTFSNLTASASNLGNATANTFAVTTDNFTIAGTNLKDYIQTIVTNTIHNSSFIIPNSNIISPVASIDEIHTNVISPLADNGEVKVKGKLLANKVVIAPPVTATDSAAVLLEVQGSASISGNLTAQNASISGNLASNSIQTNDASVSGKLATNTLVSNSASISGILAAGNIRANQLSISGNLSMDTVHATFGIFEQGITSLGPITATQVTAMDTLAVGQRFTISNNAINTVGADLEIQSLRQGKIAFEGGLIKMDAQGNMDIGGNLNVLGNIAAVKGVFDKIQTHSLAADIISPLADSALVIARNPNDVIAGNATQSNDPLLDVRGSLTASGSGTFSKLNFNLVGEAQASSLTEAVATGSAGFATLRQGQPELTIKNPLVTNKSLIYITPFGDTNNKVLYLLRQTPNDPVNGQNGSFTIGLSGTPFTKDIQFNWLIVN